MCKTGGLRAIPPRDYPANFVCRSCKEKFRAEYRPDPENETRILIFGVRHNPKIDQELANVGAGQEFMECMNSRVAKLNELKSLGMPMELETVYIGYVEALAGDQS
jgi:hypothetical protein